MHEIRYAARSLSRTPALASALLLTVALGIGANLAVQGFIRGLLAPEPPIPQAEGLVSLFAWDDQHQRHGEHPARAARYHAESV